MAKNWFKLLKEGATLLLAGHAIYKIVTKKEKEEDETDEIAEEDKTEEKEE